ncbi:hypothetical protein M885DRAFT_616727 [Pelagophyceae sp. CCMP2097]|nr:hypothetical protein M885DRAFT_616727 [Pelagophyceae sp. CCMP2097]
MASTQPGKASRSSSSSSSSSSDSSAERRAQRRRRKQRRSRSRSKSRSRRENSRRDGSADRGRRRSRSGDRGGRNDRSDNRSDRAGPRRVRSGSRENRPADHKARETAFPDGYVERHRIFVGGVPKVTTEVFFARHFEQFGALARVELSAERSFGFVTFREEAAVERALEQRMHQRKGRVWSLRGEARTGTSEDRVVRGEIKRRSPFQHSTANTAFIEVRRPKPRR